MMKSYYTDSSSSVSEDPSLLRSRFESILLPMPDAIKNDRYFREGFRELDETLAETTEMLAESLPLDDNLRSLVPWQEGKQFPQAIPQEHAREGAQLLSICFELLNIVEERVAWQFRSARRAEHGATAIKGLWPSVINRFKEEGLTEADAIAALKKVRVDPVITAHPTEAKRPSVRQRHKSIYEELRSYEVARQDPHHGRRVSDSLRAEFQTLWYTGEIFVQRPDIQEELRSALPYLSETFPEVVLRLDRSLELAWQDAGWDINNLRLENAYPKIYFASWIGGDRDGHPFVTPKVTESTLAELNHNAVELQKRHLQKTAEKLTLAPPFTKVPLRLIEAITALTELLGEAGERIAFRYRQEPWQAYLRLLGEKFTQRLYPTKEEYVRDLELAHETLIEVKATRTAHEWIFPLMRLAKIFGLHLASLDIRNNSEAHDQAAAELFATVGIPDGENFASWPEEKRCEFLVSELRNPRPFLSRYEEAGEKADHILAYLRLLATHLRKKGSDGLGQLIISMTRSVSDLLLVQVLAREAGLAKQTNGLWRSKLPVSPLFETGEDLANAHQILKDYLSIMGPHPSGMQPAMVGYSDSNKDAGVFASQWGIFKGQESMTKVCANAGVVPQFFHGRGGTIGRGAGPTRWFLRALPAGSLAGPVRVTEQGEVLPRKYGHEGNAHFHLELLTAGVTRIVGLNSHRESPVNDCRAALDALASESDKAYRRLLEADGFINFYRTATPIDALETGVFGSRPSRRTGNKAASLDDLRAIPWVFSWTQSRFYLPGWYGVGSGLEAIGPEAYALVKENLTKFDFLRYVFTNIESSLASANPETMKQYAALCPDQDLAERVLGQILCEFEKTKSLVYDLFGREFDSRRPRMEKTLEIREVPLRVLHDQQISLLKNWRASGSQVELEDGRFDKSFLALQLTINAISSGLRETG